MFFHYFFSLAIEKKRTFPLICTSVNLHFLTALTLLPIAAIGHMLGLKAHNAIMRNNLLFKRWVGGGLVVVSVLGLWQLYSKHVQDSL